MNVYDLYKTALSLLSEEAGREKWYYKMRFPVINRVIAECFAANNMFLASKGMPTLSSIPCVTKDSDIIPYDDALVKTCMPYGVASLLVIDDDKDKSAALSGQFEALKKRICPALFEDI